MNRRLKLAVLLTSLGMLAAAGCLIKTTPVTMSLFFFVGIPCVAAGILLYLSLLLKFLGFGMDFFKRRSES